MGYSGRRGAVSVGVSFKNRDGEVGSHTPADFEVVR